MDFNLTTENEINVILNLFIQHTDGTFQYGIENKEKIKELFPDLYNKEKYIDGDFIFDNYISKNVEVINNFFVIRITKDINESSINKLASFATEKSISILQFPEANSQTCNHTEFVPRYYNENGIEIYKNCFIKFVDVEKDYLSSNNISISNQRINFLAHEIGHALDEKIDRKKYNEKDIDYKIKRENNAWDIAIAILRELNITETKIELQKELCVNSYLEYFKTKNLKKA